MTLTLFPKSKPAGVYARNGPLVWTLYHSKREAERNLSHPHLSVTVCLGGGTLKHGSSLGEIWRENVVPRLYLQAPWFSHEPEVDILSTVPTP